ncbi:hypothetical protein C8J57DRAFT_1459327 [Mycena rebaudengoi]|nr:hypothetical protein C8J57DRAFT_1459327 [Mycena rebaudengoi]
MKAPMQIESLIQYTSVAATTIEDVAGSFHIPFLASAATLSLSILKCVESVKSIKDEWRMILEQIHEVLCIIAKLCSTSEIKGVLPTALLYEIAKFTETLQKIYTYLKAHRKLGKIKQLFKQAENTAKLEACKQELLLAVELFRVRATGSTLSHAAQIEKDAKQQHEELVALLEAYPDFTSDCSSIGTGSNSGNSSGSFSLLPASPKIFHGREAELHDVVNVLLQSSARLAILGTGGMGKTSVATAALHHPQVEAKYSHRYFVPCQSSPTCTELVAAIAEHIGVEQGSNLSKKVAHYFSHAPPSLLVLDNLETPWEHNSSRAEVEEFLSLLTDVPHLGLMITLRGAERPAKVKWNRPFLAPLKPLSTEAALLTFFEVADDGHDDDSVKELLELTGNLPLAPGHIDYAVLHEFTHDPGAQELLRILSILPDGLTDTDLVQANLPIIDILACKATLIRTALAFVGQDQRLTALPPIREHVLTIHPPANFLKLKLREHFHKLLDLWYQFKNLDTTDIVPQISRNLGNFNAVLLDGLHADGPDMVQNFKGIIFLNQFYGRVQNTYSPLLLKVLEHMSRWKDQPIFGEYLIQLLESSDYFPVLDAETYIALGTEYFRSAQPLEQAKWRHALGYYFQWSESNLTEALDHYQESLSLADSNGSMTIVGHQALSDISMVLMVTGDPVGALERAKKAHRYAEHIGHIHGQVWSLYSQARCQEILAHYQHSRSLLQNARDLVISSGLEGGTLDRAIRFHEAEIHLLKSEYLESRRIQEAIASSCHPTSHHSIVAKLNIALIDTVTGADSKLLHQNLDTCQSHSKALYGFQARELSFVADLVTAELCLRDQAHASANAMFKKCLVTSRDIAAETTLLCLERLGDFSTGMNDIQTTLQWAGMLLVLALKCKNKLQTIQAFRCLGQTFIAQGDNETALSLFRLALCGFTSMDIHRWKADCMVRIADIENNRGETVKAVELWKAARPLFERSSQVKAITQIDAKLAEVNVTVLDV